MAFQNQNNIFSAPFVKNVSKLFSVNVLVGLIGFAAAPILTRLYSPEDFAAFAVFMTITGFLSILATARLEYAVILSKEDETADTLSSLALRNTLFVSLGSAFLLWVTKDFWESFFDISHLSHWLIYVAPTVFLIGINQLYSQLSIRKRRFTNLGASQLITGISNPVAKIALTFQNIFQQGLMLGFGLAQLLGAIVLLVKHFRISQLKLATNWKETLFKYKEFPLYNMPHVLSNSLSGNLPYLLLIPIFGDYIVGLYSVAMMVVFKPISMLGNAVYQVLSQRTIARHHQQLPLLSEVKKLVLSMFSVAIVPSVIFTLFAPQLFGWILGHQYNEAGQLIIYIMPWLLMVFVTTPLSFVPHLYKKQLQAMIFDIIYLVLRLIAIFIGIYFNSFVLSIALYGAIGALMQLFYLIWILGLLQKGEKQGL